MLYSVGVMVMVGAFALVPNQHISVIHAAVHLPTVVDSPIIEPTVAPESLSDPAIISMKQDLILVQAGIASVMINWKNMPPGVAKITFEKATHSWAVTYNKARLASGNISTGNQLFGTIWKDGSWCIEAIHPNMTQHEILRSDTALFSAGFCPTSAIGGAGNLPK